jgi:hypothetical protein
MDSDAVDEAEAASFETHGFVSFPPITDLNFWLNWIDVEIRNQIDAQAQADKEAATKFVTQEVDEFKPRLIRWVSGDRFDQSSTQQVFINPDEVSSVRYYETDDGNELYIRVGGLSEWTDDQETIDRFWKAFEVGR